VHNRVETSFSCKINYTAVKLSATKFHINPDETDRARSQESPSKETPTPGQNLDSGGLLTPHRAVRCAAE